MASNGLDFERKSAYLIGLHFDPPQPAKVFCINENNALQVLVVLESMALGAPRRLGQRRIQIVQRSALSLYAALDVQPGQVLSNTAMRDTTECH